MIYDISDIHGGHNAYRRTLREFSLKPTDTIYVLATGGRHRWTGRDLSV